MRFEILERVKDKASQEDMACAFKDLSKVLAALNDKASFDDVRDIVAAQSAKPDPLQRVDRKLYERFDM